MCIRDRYLNIVKNSSLAAAIGYPDMVSLCAGTVLNQTGQAIETLSLIHISQYAMRIWLDADLLNKYKLTPVDVINQLKVQNDQIAAGQIYACGS